MGSLTYLSGFGLCAASPVRMVCATSGDVMPAAKPDRRVQRTRAALMQAFVGEILTRGYEEVSVDDIARLANVGRSTFYMHYHSKDDLLREALSRPSSILATIIGGDVTPEMLVPQLVHFHEQRVRNGVFFREPARHIWASRLAEMMEPRLGKLARHLPAQPQLPLPLIVHQLAEGQITLLAGWLTGRPGLKPEAIAAAMIASSHAAVGAFLGLPASTPPLIPGEKLRVSHRNA
jgi:AcrR family transcriptional regulator